MSIQQVAETHYLGKAGKYLPGVVVNNNNPNKNFFIKARISQLYANYTDDELPWSAALSCMFLGSIQGGALPSVGEQVWIFFPEEGVEHSYWVGKNIISNSQLSKLIPSYPDGYGSVDAMGTTLIVDTKNKTYSFTFPDGSGYSWASSNKTFNIMGNDTLNIKGNNLNIAATETLNLAAKTISLNGNEIDIGGTTTNITASTAKISASSTTVDSSSINLQGQVNSSGGGGSGSSGTTTNDASSITTTANTPPTLPAVPPSTY